MGLSVIIITKDEAKDLPRALESVAFADEVIVLDSGSADGTQKIAKDWGAKLFETNDWPGFGPQKNRALEKASQDWVLSLDADEWVEPDLALEIRAVTEAPSVPTTQNCPVAAYRMRRRSVFVDRVIRFGDWRRDRVVRLFRRTAARFTDDLVHERLIVNGLTSEINGFLGHFSVRSIEDSRSKMWHYNRSAASRIALEGRGGPMKGLLKAVFSLFRGLVLKLGFLDGIRGLQLAWFNAHGTYIRYALAQRIQDENTFKNRKQSIWHRVRDFIDLLFFDHGFLRVLYSNCYRLPGGLYRSNQPSPSRLAMYKKRYGIKTVVNLRGQNKQLGWYRLEELACQELNLVLLNTQVFSRGLVDQNRLRELENIIQSLELPALVHCKSGADRAGFFSVLYRHYRLGEPLENAIVELGLKYGHVKAAKTGVLDFFFESYQNARESRQSFNMWANMTFDKEIIQSKFESKGLANWIVDQFLRRE